jgi:hypothetical protein
MATKKVTIVGLKDGLEVIDQEGNIYLLRYHPTDKNGIVVSTGMERMVMTPLASNSVLIKKGE